MPLSDLGPFLLWGSILSLAMAIIWLFRTKAKGTSAFVMAGAFVVLAGMFHAMRTELPTALIIALGVVLVALLGIDIGLRSARREDAKP